MPEDKIKVSCNSCGLITKIPATDSLPPCDECGGALTAFDAAAPAQPATVECADCGAANPEGSRFCESCGGALEEQPRARRPKQNVGRVARRRANIELGEAHRAMKRVKTFFIVLACLYGLGFLILIAASGQIDPQEVDMAIYNAALAMSGLTLLFCILGAAFIQRNPFAWSLALSCMLTVNVVLSLATGSLPILGIILALGCWGATGKLANMKHLLQQYKDTISAQRIMGTHRRTGGGEVATRATMRSMRNESGGPKVAIYAIGVVAVLAVVIGIALSTGDDGDNSGSTSSSNIVLAKDRDAEARARLERERSFEPMVQEFVAAWLRSDRDAIAALVPSGAQREVAMRDLDRSLERYEFAGDLPEIDDRRDLWSRRDPDNVKTYFRLPNMTGSRRAKLRTNWMLTDDKWDLLEVGLTGTKR